MSNIMDRLKKNSRIKDTQVLSKSSLFKPKDMIQTEVPMMNVALSGQVDGGLSAGLLVLAGPSKHFKSSFALVMAKAFLDKYKDEDPVILFYDSEFGTPQAYFENFGIDPSKVLHTPITDIEELQFDLSQQMDGIDKKDRVMIIVDSIGNLASKKEAADALEGNSKVDMTRAKTLKALFRIITPYLTLRDIPMVTINHVYQEMGLFPKAIVSGGTGITYSANTIWIIGRRQTKKGTEVTGYDFVVNIEKSRFVKEKSKIPISVSWNDGIEQYSGLLEVALAGGYVVKPRNGWYCKVNTKTGEMVEPACREKDTLTAEFWDWIFNNSDFADFIMKQYKIGETGTGLSEDFIEEVDKLKADDTKPKSKTKGKK